MKTHTLRDLLAARPKINFRAMPIVLLGVVLMFTQAGVAASEPDIEARIYKGPSGTMPYRVLKPDPYDPAIHYPLVVALHGAWGRGLDNKSRAIDAFGTLSSAEVRKSHPAFVITPQCPPKQQWANTPWGKGSYSIEKVKISSAITLVLEIIPALQEEFSIDPNRIYVTGQSMGGYGAWDIVMRRPHLFAAAVPVCGAADPTQATNLAHLPIWCFHGGKDTVVPTSASREMDEAMKQAGNKQWIYTEYPTVGHGASKPTWKEPELIPWLFRQRKAEPTSK
ncbi:MAG: prolyl oligopeptidase family serine peptidase [Verrucomicrobia bacterium]|jgi:predicted peptidase|nr:prolyl oligopeptidase family serine peptidase [Verrucomicrobiota bacterium]